MKKRHIIIFMIAILVTSSQFLFTNYTDEITRNFVKRNKKDEVINLINELETAYNTNNTNMLAALVINTCTTEDEAFSKANIKLESSIDLARFNSNKLTLSLDLASFQIITDKKIVANINMNIYSANEKMESNFNLEFVRKDNQMYIVYNPTLKIIHNYFNLDKNAAVAKTTNLNRINNNALIPYPHTYNPTYYDINRTVTLNEINKEVFGNWNEIDIAKVHYGSSYNDVAVFTTDNCWQRIIYGDKNANNYKSISRETMNLIPWYINGLATPMNTTGNNYIFATSGRTSNNLHKYLYNPSTNNLQLVGNYTIPSAICPSDISCKQSRTQFVICDPATGIKVLNSSCLLIGSYTQYYYQGAFHPIENVCRLEVDNAGPSIGFVDRNGSRFVIAFVNDLAGNRLEAYNVIEVNSSSIGDVGINYDNEFYFSQGNTIHKFNHLGEYICSFNNSQWFNKVGCISNIAFDHPSFPTIELYISNLWSDSHGIRRFLLGSDAIDLSFNQNGNQALNFYYRITGDSYVEFKIYKGSVLKYSKTYNWLRSGLHMETLNYTDLGVGSFTMKISFKHWQDDSYNEYSQTLRTKSLNFSVTDQASPIISYFHQTPNPHCYGSSGLVYVHLSRGTDVSYAWELFDEKPGTTMEQHGNYCQINYPASRAGKGEAYYPKVRCIVTNSYGSDIEVYNINTSNCGGCPTLAFDNEGTLYPENPILVNSPDNPETDVIDYYLIEKKIKPKEKEISLAIHEPETQKTLLDQLQLWEVKANPSEEIAVTDEGKVITYMVPSKPQKVILNDSLDITTYLCFEDSITYYLNAGDKIRLELSSGENTKDESTYGVISGTGPVIKDKNVARVCPGGNEKNQVKGNIYLRPFKSKIAKDFGSFKSNFVEIIFEQDAELDQTILVKNLQTGNTKILEMKEALYNLQSEVTNLITDIDQAYTYINPGDRIDAKFKTQSNGNGNRRYILVTTGKYSDESKLKKDEQKEIIPLQTELKGNYPNPFNPVTIFSYSLSEAGHVEMKIYDVLGNEVAEILNENKNPGNYELEFNASNLASGVYICRFVFKDYVSTKKLILLK